MRYTGGASGFFSRLIQPLRSARTSLTTLRLVSKQMRHEPGRAPRLWPASREQPAPCPPALGVRRSQAQAVSWCSRAPIAPFTLSRPAPGCSPSPQTSPCLPQGMRATLALAARPALPRPAPPHSLLLLPFGRDEAPLGLGCCSRRRGPELTEWPGRQARWRTLPSQFHASPALFPRPPTRPAACPPDRMPPHAPAALAALSLCCPCGRSIRPAA